MPLLYIFEMGKGDGVDHVPGDNRKKEVLGGKEQEEGEKEKRRVRGPYIRYDREKDSCGVLLFKHEVEKPRGKGKWLPF